MFESVDQRSGGPGSLIAFATGLDVQVLISWGGGLGTSSHEKVEIGFRFKTISYLYDDRTRLLAFSDGMGCFLRKKWLLVIFLFLIILGGAYFFLPKKASYSLQEAACIFNELPEHCLDSSKFGIKGLLF